MASDEVQPRCGQPHSYLLLLIVDGGFIKPSPVIATFEAALLGLTGRQAATMIAPHYGVLHQPVALKIFIQR